LCLKNDMENPSCPIPLTFHDQWTVKWIVAVCALSKQGTGKGRVRGGFGKLEFALLCPTRTTAAFLRPKLFHLDCV
jgi:hypothetical protein